MCPAPWWPGPAHSPSPPCVPATASAAEAGAAAVATPAAGRAGVGRAEGGGMSGRVNGCCCCCCFGCCWCAPQRSACGSCCCCCARGTSAWNPCLCPIHATPSAWGEASAPVVSCGLLPGFCAWTTWRVEGATVVAALVVAGGARRRTGRAACTKADSPIPAVLCSRDRAMAMACSCSSLSSVIKRGCRLEGPMPRRPPLSIAPLLKGPLPLLSSPLPLPHRFTPPE
mmetsp:Transcript_13334/g.36179  ORF Transcript_13334/g.36179 Transcript_13334/m.36179 type:complete len:227 (-) Transcript_13334:322-1002(-)